MIPLLDLTGRVALVTGASSGIGAATAVTLADLGAKVALSYHRNRQGAEDDARADRRGSRHGDRRRGRRPQVRRRPRARRIARPPSSDRSTFSSTTPARSSARFGILEITEERLNEIVALNFTSAVLASQAVAASMIERKRGAIINVVSIAGHNGGGPGASLYASSKAALNSFTKGLAKELASAGHTGQRRFAGRDRHAVPRGVLDAGDDSELREDDPARPRRHAAECATVIAFLASDAASYVVGETIEVNGGQLMR